MASFMVTSAICGAAALEGRGAAERAAIARAPGRRLVGGLRQGSTLALVLRSPMTMGRKRAALPRVRPKKRGETAHDIPIAISDQCRALRECHALVLNADYQPLSHAPLSVWSWQDAVKASVTNRVKILEVYDGMVVRSVDKEFPAPSVVVLNSYVTRSLLLLLLLPLRLLVLRPLCPALLLLLLLVPPPINSPRLPGTKSGPASGRPLRAATSSRATGTAAPTARRSFRRTA